MFNQLLRLYRKHSLKTPLEDFTTEVFVGILNMEEEIKDDFIYKFLKLGADNYQLKTQVKYYLDDDTDCIVDFVLEGSDHICFIENKVNSSEGWRQLERYSKVLDIFATEKETKLIYCTKFYEKKDEISHDFNQIRWYEIATFLKPYKENNTVSNFLNFLKKHRMSEELTFTINDFVTFDKMQSSISIVKGYLDRVKPIFAERFGQRKNPKNGCSIEQILQQNRMVYHYEPVFKSSGYSEIKYGFSFEQTAFFVDIFVYHTHEKYQELTEIFKNYPKHFTTLSNGILIGSSLNISSFLNDESADSKIKEWFTESFDFLEKFKAETPEIEWTI